MSERKSRDELSTELETTNARYSRPSPRDDRLDRVLADYLHALEAGVPPDRAELLKQHPDLAADLGSFFRNRDAMERIAEPIKEQLPGLPGTIGASNRPAAGVGTALRYFGDYELLEEIARGGMGVVYKARQVSLNRIVAVKMILAGQLASAGDVARFQAEAEAAGNLDHPHIVPIYEVGEYDGQHYFSMKLVEGGSLSRLMAGPKWPTRTKDAIKQSAELMVTLARAVHHAHQRGILHRDLKPANVLLGATGEPHITDFGLAKRVEGTQGLTQTGAMVGTPAYMAPEQVRAEKQLTTAVDIYGLGAILYEMLTGRPPFQAATPFDTLAQVLERDPLPPRKIHPDLDRDLETIALKCMNKQQESRYVSAAALADDLQRWLGGEPIMARPAGPMERATKWVRRRPVVAGLLAAMALVATVGIGAFLWAFDETLTARDNALGEQKKTAAALIVAKEQTKIATEKEKEANNALIELAKQKKIADDNWLRAEWKIYANSISNAQSAWNDNNVVLGNEYLAQCRPEFRGWEYDYLSDLFNKNQRTFRGHLGLVVTVSYSADGQRIVSGSTDGKIKVWDSATGLCDFTLDGHSRQVLSVSFRSDGKSFVSCGAEGIIKIWETATGKVTATFPGPKVIVSAFSGDGTRIATGSEDGAVIMWDVATRQQIFSRKGHTKLVSGVSFSGDGKRIVSGSYDGQMKVWDAATGEELLTLPGWTRSVSFSADGKRIVGGGVSEAKVWDAATGQELFALKGHTDEIRCLAFSQDGKWIASGSGDNTLRIWDAATGREIFTLKGHVREVNSVSFSGDGKWIVSGSYDKTLKVWGVTTGQESLVLKGHTFETVGVSFTSDGKRIFSGALDGIAKIWDAATGDEILSLTIKAPKNYVPGMCFSSDGKRIVSGAGTNGQTGGELKVWDAATGNEMLTLKGHTQLVTCVSLRADGKRIISGSADKTVKVWDAATGQNNLTLVGHTQTIRSVSISGDGRRIVSGAGTYGQPGGELKVWDAATGKEAFALKGHTEVVTCVSFSVDGQRIVSGSTDKTVRVWDAATGEETLILNGHTDGVASVAISGDGKRIISGGYEKVLRIWDATTGQETISLKGHASGIVRLAIDRDTKRIVSGSRDGSLRIWDARVSPSMNTSNRTR